MKQKKHSVYSGNRLPLISPTKVTRTYYTGSQPCVFETKMKQELITIEIFFFLVVETNMLLFRPESFLSCGCSLCCRSLLLRLIVRSFLLSRRCATSMKANSARSGPLSPSSLPPIYMLILYRLPYVWNTSPPHNSSRRTGADSLFHVFFFKSTNVTQTFSNKISPSA